MATKSRLELRKRRIKRRMPAWLEPLTSEFRKLVKESEPKSPGKAGKRLLLHYVAGKLAEVLARPDVYGDDVVVQELAAQRKTSVRKFAKSREGYIQLAELQGLKPALTSETTAKPLSPARVRTLLKRLDRMLDKTIDVPRRGRAK